MQVLDGWDNNDAESARMISMINIRLSSLYRKLKDSEELWSTATRFFLRPPSINM